MSRAPAAIVAALVLSAASPAHAQGASTNDGKPPFVDAQAVEGGLVPKLDPTKLSGPTRLCGWWDNPTPGNVSLTDRGGEWTIAMQGMYEARGDGPDFKPGQQLPKGAPHGYGCACITARVDATSRFVYSFTDAKALSPQVCRADPGLKKSGFK